MPNFRRVPYSVPVAYPPQDPQMQAPLPPQQPQQRRLTMQEQTQKNRQQIQANNAIKSRGLAAFANAAPMPRDATSMAARQAYVQRHTDAADMNAANAGHGPNYFQGRDMTNAANGRANQANAAQVGAQNADTWRRNLLAVPMAAEAAAGARRAEADASTAQTAAQFAPAMAGQQYRRGEQQIGQANNTHTLQMRAGNQQLDAGQQQINHLQQAGPLAMDRMKAENEAIRAGAGSVGAYQKRIKDLEARLDKYTADPAQRTVDAALAGGPSKPTDPAAAPPAKTATGKQVPQGWTPKQLRSGKTIYVDPQGNYYDEDLTQIR